MWLSLLGIFQLFLLVNCFQVLETLIGFTAIEFKEVPWIYMYLVCVLSTSNWTLFSWQDIEPNRSDPSVKARGKKVKGLLFVYN